MPLQRSRPAGHSRSPDAKSVYEPTPRPGHVNHPLRLFCMPFLITIALASSGLAKPTKEIGVPYNWGESIALGAVPKYKPGFSHLEYAETTAQKGGELRLGKSIPIDSLNPFVIKGVKATSINDLVFERLGYASLDEPFSNYGLLFESIKVDADGLGASIKLRKNAKFSDDHPLTSEDVVFSFNTMISPKALPSYAEYYADVASVTATDPQTVSFKFKKVNRELALLLCEIHVLPKHIYSKGDFATDFTQVAVGSGPYKIKSFQSGKILELERNPNYWGRDLPVNKGRFNFDKITFKIYRDQNIWLEGLKAGDFDYGSIESSKQWATDLSGEKFNNGQILKEKWPNDTNQGLQGFAMNTRRPIFKSLNTRKALSLALDFPWMNNALFYNQYEAGKSFFNNSEFAATGLPSPEELKLLEPFRGRVPDAVFREELKPVGAGLDTRGRLLAAKKLLEEDGWKSEGGKLFRDGQPLAFKILLSEPFWQRIAEPYANALKNLGVDVSIQMVDGSVYQRRMDDFDYDMVVQVYGESESLGNEQRNFWHSATADVKGSDNIIGIKNPAVDALVEAIIGAKSRHDLVVAAKAMDRVLWFNYYLVPQWYLNYNRVAYWSMLKRPKNLPKYYAAESYMTQFGWTEAKKNP